MPRVKQRIAEDEAPADFPARRRRNPTPPPLSAETLTDNQRRVLNLLADNQGLMTYADAVTAYRGRGYSEVDFLFHIGNGLQPRYLRACNVDEIAEAGLAGPSLMITSEGYGLLRNMGAEDE